MFDLGALLTLVASKPGLAPQLDAMGIPPPNDQIMKLGMGGGDDLGGKMNLGMGPAAQGSGPPATLNQQSQIIPTPGQAPLEMPNGGMTIPTTPSQVDMISGGNPLDANPTLNPASDTSANGPASPGASTNSNMMAALAGLKGVGQPVQPFTHGGVVGGVKAPEMHPANPALMNSIVQLLMHPHASGVQAGPSLGQLIR